jgi:ribonucleoside-diphosphate reductase alpha chain
MTTVPSKATCVNRAGSVVLKKRYLAKNGSGEAVESPEELFWRVANCTASAERAYGAEDEQVRAWAETFYTLMATGKFEPNTPTLINAGRNNGLGYSACYVLPIDDSLVKGEAAIYKTLADMAAIHQAGGGTGFSFSKLRPDGDIVNTTSGVASGPVSFMSLYDSSTDTVKQGGTRRGANMGIMHCSHPDIFQFISCKSDISKITNFNISVAVTEDFMRAVADDDDWDLVNPTSGLTVKTVPAKELFKAITSQAHKTGEPGLFFIDEANKYNPVPHLGSYDATNPCGEQPLLPYDVCNLGSLNVGAYVKYDTVDWDTLETDIHHAIRFLDDIIDVNNYPLPQINNLSKNIRRIGLGVMGWADLLIRLHKPYDSRSTLKFTEQFMRKFNEIAHDASAKLAEEKGVFPEWENSAWGPKGRNQPQRNCNVTTVAPTGSISIIAGCSSGIEPLFAVAFTRKQADTELLDVNKDFIDIAKQEGWYTEELMKAIAISGHINRPDVPKKWQKIFVTAHDIDYKDHIKVQAAFQKHCDSAISKTINMDKSATEEDVCQAYLLAHALDCKGVTVYRDGSRPEQVLSTGKTTEERPNGNGRRKRPEFVKGFTRKVEFANLGKVYITVNFDPETNEPVEVFLEWGRAGSDEKSLIEAIGRLISLHMKEGIPLDCIVKQLRGIGGKTRVFHKGNTFSSIPDAIAKTLIWAKAQEAKSTRITDDKAPLLGNVCPDCENELSYSEGCHHCAACGYSACS